MTPEAILVGVVSFVAMMSFGLGLLWWRMYSERFVSAVVFVPDAHVVHFVEAMPLGNTSSTGHLSRLSTFDLRDGTRRGWQFIGGHSALLVSQTDAMLWFESAGNIGLHGRDPVTGALRIHQAQLCSAIPELNSGLIDEGNHAPTRNEESGRLLVTTRDGRMYWLADDGKSVTSAANFDASRLCRWNHTRPRCTTSIWAVAPDGRECRLAGDPRARFCVRLAGEYRPVSDADFLDGQFVTDARGVINVEDPPGAVVAHYDAMGAEGCLQLSLVDWDGSVRWTAHERDLALPTAGLLGSGYRVEVYGATCVDDTLVLYLARHCIRGPRLCALDLATGAVRWTTT